MFYGSPISSGLGILGVFPPEEAATRVRDEAALYDRLNGDRGARPAIDLIFEGATAEPTPEVCSANRLAACCSCRLRVCDSLAAACAACACCVRKSL